ncbi:MAG: hypothetical protein KOO63_13735 [Bacteroidales bacterium]|nr:hypothetical protein [Candidatus Latescibacterota bacterium]
MKQTLKLLAPYIAVGVFWCGFSNAWLAILAYHGQILFWSRRSLSDMRWPDRKRIMLLALPAVLAGPLFYFILPYIAREDLSVWLADHHLSRLSLLAMIPYFGIIHPFLEQLHWAELRKHIQVSHPVFAGYHIVVLYSLLNIPGLILCFVVFTTVSSIWYRMTKRTDSLAAPLVSHILADLGLILAAWLKV